MAAAISSASILAAAQVDDEAEAYELSLHHTGLRSMLGLSRCVRLRVLDLSFNALRAIEGLDALGDLRELKVYANEIAHIAGLDVNIKLQTLLLHDNRLGGTDGNSRTDGNSSGGALLNLTQLATLRIDTNPRLGPKGIAALRLDCLPGLTELDASATSGLRPSCQPSSEKTVQGGVVSRAARCRRRRPPLGGDGGAHRRLVPLLQLV